MRKGGSRGGGERTRGRRTGMGTGRTINGTKSRGAGDVRGRRGRGGARARKNEGGSGGFGKRRERHTTLDGWGGGKMGGGGLA